MSRRRYEEYEQGVHLPSPTGVGCAILRSSSGENLDLARLVAALRADPASTLRVLEACRRHHPASRACTVADAARMLHPRHMHETAVCFRSRGQRRGARREFDHDYYWRWSLACACAAEQAAVRDARAGIDPELAWTVALLSRVGLLMLATAEPAACDALLRDHATRPIHELLMAQSRRFDCEQYELGASRLAALDFPAGAVRAVRELGLPPRDGGPLPPDACAWLALLHEAEQAAWDIVDAAPSPGEAAVGRNGAMRSYAPRSVEVDDGLRWRTMRRLRDLSRGFEPPPGPRELVQGAVARPSGESTQGLRVIAVDDDAVDLRILAAALERDGCEVDRASSGAEALALMRSRPAQAVLTDWSMPDMDGSELCRRLRELPSGKDAFLVVLTALDDEQRAIESFEAGADEYVTKPFNPRVLLARVRSGLRHARLHDRSQSQLQAQRAADRATEVQEQMLSSLATVDSLTGLPNRRRALEFLQRQWEHAQRTGAALSVALVDLDHFKRVNDEHGHDAGDEVLRAAARILKKHARRGDLLARFGGEEFLLVCPGAGAEAARLAGERMRTRLSAEPVLRAGFHGRLTLSVGVAARGPGMLGVEGLLKAADEALFEAKRAGRDRVAVAKAS